MPKGAPPPWTSRDCRFDYLVVAVAGLPPGTEVKMDGIETAERAEDIRKGFYRCAGHRRLSAWVSWQHAGNPTTLTDLWPPDRQPDGTYTLLLSVTDKTTGRRRHMAVYGPDRQKWPYNPRGPKSAADTAAWAARGLDEKGHRIR
jgi:hypothetical protein